MPEPNTFEIIDRLKPSWQPFAFWIIGTLTIFLLRPMDDRWKLMIVFNFLSAVWLMAGSTGFTELWNVTTVMRSAIWLSVPVYLHFHWVFPSPFAPLPKRTSVILYIVFIGLAVSEWIWPSLNSRYLYGLLIAVIGSLILLVVHAVKQPAQRRSLTILVIGIAISVMPSIILTIGLIFGHMPQFGTKSMWTLPFLPAAYFSTLYQQESNNLRTRANRTITTIGFGVLALIIMFILVEISLNSLPELVSIIEVAIGPGLLLVLITLLSYPFIEQMVEKRLLGMTIQPARLLETYSASITTSLEIERLVHLLRDEALPSLLIHQAALVSLDGSQSCPIIFNYGLSNLQLPDCSQIARLADEAGRIRHLDPQPTDDALCPWARLILPLNIDNALIGLLLLGARDLDNNYSEYELPAFTSLANQTALALVNIQQAERLRLLYQKDIERQENERVHLARELHDDVLNRLAVLPLSIPDAQASQQFTETYQNTINHIRTIINGLRPNMLNYGLGFALEEFIEETSPHGEMSPRLVLDLPPSTVNYPPEIELHLFRIVQQACHNAIQHAQAKTILIQGALENDRVILSIQDDGKGFDQAESLDLTSLLANHHYGLAGMHERAAIIGAKMEIRSSLGAGTRVRISWNKPQPQSAPSLPAAPENSSHPERSSGTSQLPQTAGSFD